jgi:hypothetical protein
MSNESLAHDAARSGPFHEARKDSGLFYDLCKGPLGELRDPAVPPYDTLDFGTALGGETPATLDVDTR